MVTVSYDSVIVAVMTEAEGWTLGELVSRVGQLLADAQVRAPNGRVTEVPDARVIRWYATIGLMDRPSGMRGRTALYGPRHLLQLVAVKRLQAQGHPLADIQAQLAGATDAVLRRIAGPTSQPAPGDATGDATSDAPGDATGGAAVDRAARFWAQPSSRVPPRPQSSPRFLPQPPSSPPPVLAGVALGGGAVLLLPATPQEADLAEIEAAARPLLDLLARRGLLTNDARDSQKGSRDDHR